MEKYYLMFHTCVSLCSLVHSQTGDVEFNLNEEISISTEVANLSEIHNLFPEMSEEQRSSLQYGILDQGNSPASLFNISRKTGAISVAMRIDRETLCLTVEQCILKVNILASAENTSQFESRVITVNFKVMDVNDNSPTFDRSHIRIAVLEGSSLDTILKIPGADDKDFTPEYKVKNYTLDSFHNVFSLSASHALDGSSEIHIRLKKSLDRETNNKYEFSITAYDGGSPPRSSILQVILDITDTNDNEPQFFNTVYNVTVDSTMLLNEVVLQVSATDADEGINALLTYGFSHLQKPLLENIVRINSTSGEIFLVGTPRPGEIVFVVEAADSGSPELKTQAIVRVHVITSGNTPPRVSITTVGANSDQSVVSVVEPGGRGVFVAFVVVDDDEGGSVICEISSQVFIMVGVANKGYKIVLQDIVDRETIPFYDLLIICQDDGEPRMNASLYFRVNIEDANDNAPVFSHHHYSRTISEGRKKGEHVLQINALDEDAGMNGAVVYSQDPVYDRYFNIDPKSGVISAIGDLDRESNPVITFYVYATDQGTPLQKSSSVEVTIILEDVNDNAPQFMKTIFTMQVMEEMEGERNIVNLLANDADEGVNGELEYFFAGSVDVTEDMFTVLSNGSIISSTKFDREKRASYSFSVMVRDKGEPSLTASATVLVQIDDINDNAPDILFPKSQNFTLLISNPPETGVVISRVIAFDDDAGENGSMTFAIASGNDDTAFEISETTGEITVAAGSRLANNKQYTIFIVVTDRGLPPRLTTTLIKIDVLFGNTSQDLVKMGSEKRHDYMLIITAVSAVTVVFSTLIIVAICVVFKRVKNTGNQNGPKRVFNDSRVQENLTNEHKLISVHQENSRIAKSGQYSLNNLHSCQSREKGTISSNRIYFLDKLDSAGPGNVSCRGTSEIYNIGESGDVSSESCDMPRRNDLQSFFPCDPSCRNSSGDYTRHPRTAKHLQNDDVFNESSSESSTSDSGRGNSIADVNVDQLIRRDYSKSMASIKRSDVLNILYNQTLPEHSRTSAQYVRHAQKSTKIFPPELHQQYNLATNYDKSRPPNIAVSRTSSSNVDCRPAYKGYSIPGNSYNDRNPKLTTFQIDRHMSVTSADFDAATTTSGSYIVNPNEIRIDTFVGADIVV